MPRPEKLSDGTYPHSSWPGLYPLFYTTCCGDELCAACATKETDAKIVRVDINYEDPHLDCDECGEMIPAAHYTAEEQLELRLVPRGE